MATTLELSHSNNTQQSESCFPYTTQLKTIETNSLTIMLVLAHSGGQAHGINAPSRLLLDKWSGV